MSRQEVNMEFNTFVGGIMTEANPINYPKGYTLDEQNFILERNGTRRRRRGMEQEANPTDNQLHRSKFATNVALDTTYWQEDKFVICDGELAYSYDITTEGTITPGTALTTRVFPTVVANHKRYLLSNGRADIGNNDNAYTKLSGSSILVAEERLNFIDPDTLVETLLPPIKIRDHSVIGSELTTTRPTGTLTNEHAYNLINAGWTYTNIQAFNTAISAYPSQADTMNSGLDAATGVFTASWVVEANAGDSQSALGSMKISLFNNYASRTEELHFRAGSLTGILSGDGSNLRGGLVDMYSYAGRMFYLFNTPGHSVGDTILTYSQSGVSGVDLTKCYSINDPTSRDNNSPLDTDGGHLDISKVGIAYKMVSIKNSLFIFGSEGVFELYSQGNVFRPINIGLRKVTSDGAMIADDATGIKNAPHVTVVGDSIMYFSKAGIMQINYDLQAGLYFVSNLTNTTIQTYYTSLPEDSRAYATGLYVASDSTVRFLVSDEAGGVYTKNIELIYDIALKAWYKNKLVDDSDDTRLLPMFSFIAKTSTSQSDYPVDDLLRYFYIDDDSGSSEHPYRICKYSTTEVADFEGTSFEQDIPAFLQTGYINAGDSQRNKQANYIIPSFIRTEDGFTDDGSGNLTPTNESSCNITAYWDYTDSPASGKLGTSFEGYRYNRVYVPSGPSDTFDYGQSVITTKNKLLGRGRALSLRFESSPGKDCRLLGWGLGFETNTKV